MKKVVKRSLAVVLVAMFTLCLSMSAMAKVDDKSLDAAVTDCAKYMYETVKDPQVGSIGGEWAVLGLARSGYNVPDQYYQNYYVGVEKYVADHKGILHEIKYTEYSRLILALTAIGRDPGNVAGSNLFTPLGDYDATIKQGLNGPIWALIALDSGNYEMPKNTTAKVQATRDMYVKRILECQLTDGGFSLFGGTASADKNTKSDADITGMALQALAKYQDKPEVKKAISEALSCMSKMQSKDGGFTSWGIANSESVVQMICALNELGLPLDNPSFVKNGNTMLDALMSYYRPGKGFLHTADGSGQSQMSSEQGLYSLVSAKRAMAGKPSLYRMTDAIKVPMGQPATKPGAGLANKNKDVKVMPVIADGKTFSDIVGHNNLTAIESLASRGIIDGKSATKFDPNGNMTRAEFSTIIVRGLGLTPKANTKFADVKSVSWYASYIGTANSYGIVEGVSANKFNPNGNITIQEASIMVARAAKLCGIDTAITTAEVDLLLKQFTDSAKVAGWAKDSLAICYDNKILDSSVKEIRATVGIKRCEVAQMIFNMLGTAQLL